MSETLFTNYDMDKIAEAKRFAKKTNNFYLEDLIEIFITESDPEHRGAIYEAIIDGTARLKRVWGYTD